MPVLILNRRPFVHRAGDCRYGRSSANDLTHLALKHRLTQGTGTPGCRIRRQCQRNRYYRVVTPAVESRSVASGRRVPAVNTQRPTRRPSASSRETRCRVATGVADARSSRATLTADLPGAATLGWPLAESGRHGDDARAGTPSEVAHVGADRCPAHGREAGARSGAASGAADYPGAARRDASGQYVVFETVARGSRSRPDLP
jgi:hypothetical protein